jgi:Mn-dependent DtxR family transcriptional regulator
VYLWLAARQTRSGKPAQVSFQEMAESMGVSKSSAQAAVRWLVRRKLLATRKENATAIPFYTVLSPWKHGGRHGH